MRKQELKEAFSKLHASEELVKEVLYLDRENRKPMNGWGIVRRVAACTAVLAVLLAALLWHGDTEDGIMTAPGILKVYACELQDMDAVQLAEYALIEGETSYKSAWCPYVNLICEGIRLSFLIKEEALEQHKITYEVCANYGEIEFHYGRDDEYTDKRGAINNGETICWTGNEVIVLTSEGDTTDDVKTKTGGIYLDVIIKADGNIIGYAVFEIVCTMPEFDFYNAILRRSVYYPKVNDNFQTITNEYIAQQIASAKSA